MADDKSSANTGAGPGSGKRPYATLDLKATEVNITPVKGGFSSASSSAAAGAEVPRPAAARSYAAETGDASEPKSEGRMQSESSRSEKPKTESNAATSSASAASVANDDAKVVIPK